MRRILRAFLYGFFLGFLSLVAVAMLWEFPILLAVVLFITAMLMLAITGKKEHVYLFLIAGVSGAMAEAFAIGFGAWTYGSAQFIGVPLWLPVLWGIAALFMNFMAEEIKDFVHHR